MELLFGQTSTPQPGNPLMSILPLVVIFAVFYFLLIMPQQRKQKQHQKLLAALQRGDRVMTSSGIYGTIASVKENVITVVIADGVKVDFDKGHIVNKIEPPRMEPPK